jgi:hypothetical protein
VSELFDAGARRLLARAYGRPGFWAETRLVPPTARQVRWAAGLGIDVNGPDDVSARGGRGINAHSRWARAFVRALYYQHRWYSAGPDGSWRAARRAQPRRSGALRVEVGRQAARLGVIPAGRIVRVQLDTGGMSKARAVAGLAESEQYVTNDGSRGGRWSDPALRDW